MKVLKGKYENEIVTRKEMEDKRVLAEALVEKLETENRNLRSQIKQFEQEDEKERTPIGAGGADLNALRLENAKL